MDNYQIVIILICQTIIQVIGFLRHNATISRRFKRLETCTLERGNDNMAREIYAMVNKISNNLSGRLLRERVREVSSSGEEDEVSNKTGGEFETCDEKLPEEQKEETKEDEGRKGCCGRRR